MTNTTQLINISLLVPHPNNPRIVERMEVIDQIAGQLRAAGSFDPANAIKVRPIDGGLYQIISGHHRTHAAFKAGLTEIPCWVREMSDDDAFMELALSNAQSELSALERGMHALQATEKGSKTGRSVAAYAEMVGRSRESVKREVEAAEVAGAVGPRGPSAADLDQYPRHLAEIHAAPASAWPALVRHLLKPGADGKTWTVKATQDAVRKVKEIEVADADRFPIEKVVDAVLAGEMAQHDITFLTAEATRILKEIEGHSAIAVGGYLDLDFSTSAFADQLNAWLVETAGADAWDVAKVRAKGRSLVTAAAAGLDQIKTAARVRKAAADAEKKRLADAEKKRIADAAAAEKKQKQDAADQRAREAAAKHAEEQARKSAAEKLFDSCSLDQWKLLDEATQKVVLTPSASNDSFNVQNSGEDENSIDWAKYTWNPITGCLHECPYCYARDIATRFSGSAAFPNGFAPTLRANRLNAPSNMKAKDSTDPRDHRVFVGSMTDLFGRWVPDEWIERVLDVAANTPAWEFLMLTKFPKRMSEFNIPDNVWMGTTVDCQARVENAERAFEKVKAKVKWISIEPLIEPLKFNRLDLFDMIAIGGASKSNKTPKWIPPYSWIEDLMKQANAAKCSVYLKSNIYLKENPGEARYTVADQAPAVFNYLRKHGEV